MSPDLWLRLADRLREHGYMEGVERTVERVQATAEVFTPTELVIDILQRLDLELLAPGKTVLDPACGDGQFLVAAKWIKILHHGMAEEEALADIFGVDIMRDNVDLCLRRLGGGTIVVGDSLDPQARPVGQTEHEHRTMLSLFSEPPTSRMRKNRVSKLAARSRASEELVPLF